MTEKKFAVLFPELDEKLRDTHPGYLWVKKLGSGRTATVDLVRSVEDQQLYARKKTFAELPARKKFHNREVHYHQSHPHIPPIYSSHSYKVLKDEHEDADTVKSTVIISKYCNGATLYQFARQCRPRVTHGGELTELFLWHLFAAQLEVVIFLHSLKIPLARTDSSWENVWLHFPDESSTWPELWTGDLGMLRTIDPKIFETSTKGEPRQLKSYKSIRKIRGGKTFVQWLAEDLNQICYNIESISREVIGIELTPSQNEWAMEETSDRPWAHDQWSRKFESCKEDLSMVLGDLASFGTAEMDGFNYDLKESYSDIHGLLKKVMREAEEEEEADFSWARNASTEPFLWSDRKQLLSDCNSCKMRGPFKVVMVDPTTFDILETEPTEYGAHNPLNLGKYDITDLVPDPLANQEIDGHFEDRDLFYLTQSEAGTDSGEEKESGEEEDEEEDEEEEDDDEEDDNEGDGDDDEDDDNDGAAGEEQEQDEEEGIRDDDRMDDEDNGRDNDEGTNRDTDQQTNQNSDRDENLPDIPPFLPRAGDNHRSEAGSLVSRTSPKQSSPPKITKPKKKQDSSSKARWHRGQR